MSLASRRWGRRARESEYIASSDVLRSLLKRRNIGSTTAPDQEHREDAFVMKKNANVEGGRPRKGSDGHREVCSWRKRLRGLRKGIEGKGFSDKKADGEQAFLS